MNTDSTGMNRRGLLRLGGKTGFVLATGQFLTACPAPNPGPGPSTTAGPTTTGGPTTTTTTTSTTTTTVPPGWTGYGPLGAADVNGLRLPSGFTSRVVATTGQTVGSTGYVWPADPDGAATFPRAGGGWIYVANHETSLPNGGVSRLEFDASGTIVAAGRILSGSDRNCAGGATPWGTWLSGEEVSRGKVWECDPTGATPAVARPAMGLFTHEAVAVHPADETLYLTEDRPDGGLYRFLPTAYPDLSAGALEVLTESAGVLSWQVVPDPSAATTSTRLQIASTKRFNGGEGICHLDGAMYFTTKGDNRVWRYVPATNALTVVYDVAASPTPVLSGVDNVTVLPTGDLYVAEDGGDMQIVMLSGTLAQAVVQLDGVAGSEMTGVIFDPSMTRMYVSSQRNPGRTYEISGPWRTAL